MDKTNKEKIDQIVNVVKANYGEEKAITIINSRKFPKDTPDFVYLFQLVSRDLSKKLSPSACKVLLYMISLMQYSNHIGCDQSTLAEELDLSIRSVSGAISELKNLCVIIAYKDPQDKKRNVYMINPHSAWKGKIQARKRAIKDNNNQIKLILGETE